MSIFWENKKKDITNSSAELAQSVVKVKLEPYCKKRLLLASANSDSPD